MTKLLTRDQFREGVLERDGYQCVICGAKAGEGINLDAHHIIERRLWSSKHEIGGYFLDNGATLCDRVDGRGPNGQYSCHMMASMTLISPDTCRESAGIKNTILPDHLYQDQKYTVWGDPVLKNGQRMMGELFWDDGVQKMLRLGGVMHLYTSYIKHPRTYHLPFSPKVLANDLGDDKVIEDLNKFKGQRVIVTVKMDGSQHTIYKDYVHARTTEFKADATTHWLQNWCPQFCYDIPEGYRINVENLYAKHGIHYQNLPSYVMSWMMLDEKNNCLSWDETVEWIDLLSDTLQIVGKDRIHMVPVLYDGEWNEDVIRNLFKKEYNGDPMEGFVVRLADKFHYRDFKRCVGKYVRADHQPQHGGGYGSHLVKNNIKQPV